jgi:hypothetical protein
MTSRFNPKPNVVYKRSWRGKFCPNNTQKWNSASSTQNWGGEFSIGTLGKFHPALTQLYPDVQSVLNALIAEWFSIGGDLELASWSGFVLS